VPEVPGATTFSVDGPTKNVWVKLFYSPEEPDRIERAHVIGVSRLGSEVNYISVDE
jgi:hypothetical protein